MDNHTGLAAPRRDARCLLSVVIVNYNAGSYLLDCIRCVMHQCDEIIVVDNASTDASIRVLEKNFRCHDRLHVIHNERNVGFATACNIGACHASGSHLLFLNPDCMLAPGVATRLIRVLRSDAAVGMVGGLLINPDGTEQGGGRRAIPTPWRSFVRAFGLARLSRRWPALFSDFHLHKQPLPRHPIEVEAISGACMLVKKSTLDEVGHWDESYFLHCEDLDLCVRLTNAGKKILFVPDARVLHYKGICSRARPVFVEWHKHLGMMRFYRKFFRHQYPKFMMWLVGLGVWLRFSMAATYYSARNAARLLHLVRD